MNSVSVKIFTFLFLLSSVFATQVKAQEDKKSVPGQAAAYVKEVFLKGSVDGQSLFLVYGFGNMTSDVKRELKEAGHDLNRDAIKLSQLVNNKTHRGDYVDAARTGAEVAEASARWVPAGFKNAVKWPWRTLKKVPRHYRLDLERASEAYYNSDNTFVGALKYSGLAVWANVKGAYYLIIEAPTVALAGIGQSVIGAVGTVISIPAAIIFQTLRVALKATGMALRAAWEGIETAARFIVSGVTSVAATTVTLVAAGGVAVYQGAKWIVGSFRNIRRPVRVGQVTDLKFDAQQEYAKKLKDTLSVLQYRNLKLKVQAKISKFKSTFKLKENGKTLLEFRTLVKERKVVVEASIMRKLYRKLRKLPEFANMKRKEIKQALAIELQGLLHAVM